MKAWFTLIRREWWEHRTSFGWAPAGIAVTGCLIAAFLIRQAATATVAINFQSSAGAGADATTRNFEFSDTLSRLLHPAPGSVDQLTHALDTLLHVAAQPFIYLHLLVAFYVLAVTLNDDRRDRSVLFWKALPVSDFATVSSKLVFVVWAAPLVTIALITLTWLTLLTLLGVAAGGTADAAHIWAVAGLPNHVGLLLLGYLLQGLWTLPLYAWTLLVSAAVPRGPLVWSGLAPLGLVLIERLVLGSDRVWLWLRAHLELAALPRPGGSLLGDGEPAIGLAEQLDLMMSADLWFGVMLGTGCLLTAVWLRRRSADI